MTISLGHDCAGIDAVSVALDMLNIDVEYEFASEVNKSYVKQIMSHYPPKTVYGDIRSRKIAHMKSVDLYVCGFPCVPFSHLGKREGINNENCGDVVFGALNYIKQKKPKNFVLENVSGFATSGNGDLCQEIVEELKSLDAYSIFVEYLNAEDYGIPQSRKRLFIIGIPEGQQLQPFQKERRKTLDEFLDLTAANPKEHTPSSTIALKLIQDKVKDNPSFDIENNYHIIDLGVSKGYAHKGRLGICPCLKTRSERYYVPRLKRFIWSKEALALQGFPPSWQSVCSESSTFKQAGNSMCVPVLMAIFRSMCLI